MKPERRRKKMHKLDSTTCTKKIRQLHSKIQQIQRMKGSPDGQESKSLLIWEYKTILTFDQLCRSNHISCFYLWENISPSSCISAYLYMYNHYIAKRKNPAYFYPNPEFGWLQEQFKNKKARTQKLRILLHQKITLPSQPIR